MRPNDSRRPINSPYLQNEHQGMGRPNVDGPLFPERYRMGQLQRHTPPEDHSARPNSPASTYPQRVLGREPGFSGTTRYSESSHRVMEYQESDSPLGAYPYAQASGDYGGEMDALHIHHPTFHRPRYPSPHASYPAITNGPLSSISMPVSHSDSTNLDTQPNVASTSYRHLQRAQPHHVIQRVTRLRHSRGQGHSQSRSLLFPQAVEYSPSLGDQNTVLGQTSSFLHPQLTSNDARQALPMQSHLGSYEPPLPAPQARSMLRLPVGHDPSEIGSTTFSERSHSTSALDFGGYDGMHAPPSIPMSNISAHNNNTTPLPTSSGAQLFSPSASSNWLRHGYEYGVDGTPARPSAPLSSPVQALGSGSGSARSSGSSVTTNILAHDHFPARQNSEHFHPSSSTHSLSSSHSSLGALNSPGPISDTDTPLSPGRDEMGDPPIGSSVSDAGGKKGEDSAKAGKKKKKSKMHQCEVCKKSFPRPSGLKTHMNTHSNAKPYHCYVPGCTRKFGVQSNAKRHLRTHGIINHQPTPTPGFAGFSPHVILQDPNRQLGQQSDSHPSGSGDSISTPLRWVPVSLASRTNASRLEPARERWHPSRGIREGSVDGLGAADMDGLEDGEDDEDDEDAMSRMSIPLGLTVASVPGESQPQPPFPSFPFTFTPSSASSHPTSSNSSTPTSSRDRSTRQSDPRASPHPYPSLQPPRHPES